MISAESYRAMREEVIGHLTEEERAILARYGAGQMSTRAKPVIIIKRHEIRRYESITDASRSISISKQRLLRALEREDGLITGVKPAMYIDYAIEAEDDE